MKSQLQRRARVPASLPSADAVRKDRSGHHPQGEIASRTRALNTIGAAMFVLLAMWAGFVNIGWPPVVIVGGSGLVAMVIWWRTYLRSPSDPSVILPVFLLTMSRVFDISWTERSLCSMYTWRRST
jgi:Flp pilus assembly protein TadB